MRSFPRTLWTAGLVASVLALTACGNEIDEEFDCVNLCERYRDCYDPSYDDEACEARCDYVVDFVDPGRADACDSCLDVTTCSQAAFNCQQECNEILP